MIDRVGLWPFGLPYQVGQCPASVLPRRFWLHLHPSISRELHLSWSLAIFATLQSRGVISAPLRQYTPVVTSELSSVYPEVEQYEHAFDFELAVSTDAADGEAAD